MLSSLFQTIQKLFGVGEDPYASAPSPRKSPGLGEPEFVDGELCDETSGWSGFSDDSQDDNGWEAAQAQKPQNPNAPSIDEDAMMRAAQLSLEDGNGTAGPSLNPNVGEAKGLAIAKRGDKVVFAVDLDMPDIPSWIEWDITINKMLLTYASGNTTTLPTKMKPDQKKDFEGIDRVMLVARMDGAEVAHFISFFIRKD